MVSKSVLSKKSESTPSEDAGDMDRLIAELNGRIAVLEKKNDDLAALNGKLRGLSQAVEQSASVVVITDTTGRIQYVNPKFTELTGYSFEEAIGKNPSILKTGETPPGEYRQLWETITSGKEWHGVFHNKKKNGDLYWESAIISPVMDDRGQITNFMAVKEDITERKQMEDALRAREEKFRLLADFTHDWETWTGRTGEYIYVSPSCERISGHSTDEFYRDQELLLKLVHPDDQALFKQHLADHLLNKSSRGHVDFRIITAGGIVRWISHNCQSVFGHNGEWLGRRASNRDITDRKRMEEALLEGEARFHALADNIPVLAWMADADGRIFWFNKQCYDYTGMTREELQGLGWQKVLHPDYAKAATAVWRSMIETGQPRDNVFPLRGKDGSYRWFLARSVPIRSEDGVITRWFGTHTDITERKQAEEALQDKQEKLEVQAEELRVNNEELERQIEERLRAEEALRDSEEKFRILADSTYDWVTWSSTAGNYVYVSPSCERITGHRADEFYNDPGLMKRIVHPDDKKAFEQHRDSNLRNASVCGNFDFRIISTSGETRWINHVCRPVFSDNGEWLGHRASNRDITERKRAEEALLVSEERLRRASCAGHIGLFEWNEGRDTIYFSPEAYELLGFDPGYPVTYKKWLSVVHPNDREAVERFIAMNSEGARLRRNISTRHEFRVVHCNGAVHWLEVQSTNVLEGSDLMVRGAMRDITERKRVEKELEDYRKRLEDLVQERTRKLDEEKRQADLYVDLMGHDISNINQAGMGNLELLQIMGNLDAQGGERVSTALQAFEKSSELIKNVKKLQKVKKGDLRLEKIDIGQILKRVEEDYKMVPGRAVTVRLEASGGCFVLADGLLHDVFSNIVGNAIKHSTGPVDISMSLSPVERGGKKFYRISIEDDGPGITPDLKKRIFDRMYYEGGIMRGKGLGLYLVHTLVEYFHGTVSVEDRISGDYSKGTRFVVELPAA